MNIYVGNLPYSTEKDELEDIFGEFGKVESIDIIVDRRSGRSRGYGFVSMAEDSEAKAAVESLNGSELGGRNLRVDISRPKQEGETRNHKKGSQGKPAQQEQAPQKSGGLFGMIKRFFS